MNTEKEYNCNDAGKWEHTLDFLSIVTVTKHNDTIINEK